MTHLLDTDVLSIWQTGAGLEYTMLALRMSAHPDVGVSVVSFHEQMIGANAYLNRGRTGADLIAGYGRLDRLR